MSHQERIDDTRPHPRLRAFQRTTPFVSWGSLLGVLGIMATLIAGGFPSHGDGSASAATVVTAQQLQAADSRLNDHEQRIRDNAASVGALKDTSSRLLQGQQDQQQQISDLKQQVGDLDYKTTRILELMLESKQQIGKDRGKP